MSSQGYDGSIKIDTRLETKGFNIGMKEMQKSADSGMDAISSVLAGMSGKFKGLGATASAALGKIGAVGSTIGAVLGGIIVVLGLIVVAIVKVVSSMIKLAAAAAKAGITMLNTMGEAVSKTSLYGKAIQDLKDLITDIKGAWYAAFAPLVQFVTPYVKMLSEWLVKIFNTVAMIIAKLLGQKTVMQYVAGSAKEADKLAKNTKKAGEAAEGALAAFDQLNVLQTEKGPTGDQEAGKMQFAEVAVNEGIIKESWEKIKEWGLKAYEWIKENGLRILQFLAISAALAWNTIWEKYKEAVAVIWERVKEGWSALWSGLRDVALAVWDRVKQGASAAWEGIKSVFRALGDWFRNNVWNPLRERFSEVWSRVRELASAAWGDVKRLWGIARDWFRVNVTDPIKNAFSSALTAIGGFFKSKFEAIKEVIVKVLNFIIDKINGLISRIVNGLNVVIGLLNKLSIPLPGFLGGGSIGFNIPKLSAPQIPRLASGAVIPPNSEFLAVMGDQRRGNNLEAPEELIRQIVREETSNTAGQEVTINFAGNMGSLIRAMKPYIDRENARVGKSLVRGIA